MKRSSSPQINIRLYGNSVMNGPMEKALDGADFLAIYAKGSSIRFVPLYSGVTLPQGEIVDIIRVHRRPNSTGAFFHFRFAAKRLDMNSGILQGEITKDGAILFRLPAAA